MLTREIAPVHEALDSDGAWQQGGHAVAEEGDGYPTSRAAGEQHIGGAVETRLGLECWGERNGVGGKEGGRKRREEIKTYPFLMSLALLTSQGPNGHRLDHSA